MFTNGLSNPTPLYIGGKEKNKLCFGTVEEPSIRLKFLSSFCQILKI